MKIVLFACTLIFVLLPIDSRQQGCAQSPSSEAPMTVTADWLKNNINDPKLVLFHIGQRAEYDAGHIPGAQYLSMQDLSAAAVPDGLALELPEAGQLKVTLEKFGISNDSRIILYFGKDWVSPTTRFCGTFP